VIVVIREDHVLDASLAQRQEHACGLWGERRVENQREGGKQYPQALDLLRARIPGEQGIHHRQLHRSSADGAEHVIPGLGLGDVESRRGGPAELVELDVRNGR